MSAAPAAVRKQHYACRTSRQDQVAVQDHPGRGDSYRAVKITVGAEAPALPLTAAPHVVEFAPPRNIAVGSETPWGVGGPLAERTAVSIEAVSA